ncbi:hypothetical protein [Oceanobacillus jeddahense]|uniref:Uncharacterized protein n=1 Tax=Oceanobacillus jeddahense TaxID=1462527 RepID=A0ABY5JTE5_9BACI|nr:hypothetical protein [Oceanobacillus jeddahense]UUI03064.1 hypothetical protein NP439_24050 [Oceanobacillus jeddahense]
MKNYNKMKELFEKSNDNFLSQQIKLIESRVSERTLCGQLMLYLNEEKNKTEYWKYYVDVEYNRNFHRKVKTIKNSEEEIIRINCDLILHSRGENLIQDNLIAIEMKKSNSSNINKEKDKERLKALTKHSFDNVWSYDGKSLPKNVCRYILGVYYEFNISRGKVLLEYYMDGQLKEKDFIVLYK